MTTNVRLHLEPRNLMGTDIWSARHDFFLLPTQGKSVGGRKVRLKHDGEEGQGHNLRIKRPGCLDI